MKPPVGADHRGVYIHFPYCRSKCPYCDFNSHVIQPDDRRYADAVIAELRSRASELSDGPVSSIYFGGGTPSLWAPHEVERVRSAVEERFGLARDAELTLEANPESLTMRRLEAYRGRGLNRFSIGVQSFDDTELAILGRTHSAGTAVRAVRSARHTGASVSLDLIYGLPDQRWASVRESLERATELEPDHISAYTLTIEPQTVLARRTRLGLFHPMPDDAQAELIERVTAYLERHGYRRYEISSYARAGHEARHNSAYWAGGAYLGLGAGAHSYLPRADGGALRRENVRSPETYVTGCLAGAPRVQFEEDLEARHVLADRLMVAMRVAWGLDPADLITHAGAPWGFGTRLVEALRQLEARGWVVQRDGRFRPTAQGFLFNDAVAMALMEVPFRDAPSPRVEPAR